MAEGDAVLYNCFKHWVLEGVYNLASGGHTLKMMLVHDYTPNIDTHTAKADVATEYGTAGGYTAGGATLANQDCTLDTANDRGKFDADDCVWTSLTLSTPATPSHAVLYDDSVSTTPVTDPLIMYFVLGTTATNGTNYTLVFGANGLILLT